MANCGDVQYVPNEDNAWIGSFANSVSDFPVVGGLVSSFIGPSLSAEQLKCVPGKKFDVRTGYQKEKIAFYVFAGLLLMYFSLRLLKK